MSNRKITHRRRIAMVGDNRVPTKGLYSGFWNDVYYRSMLATWPQFFAGTVLVFVLINLAFAGLFWLDATPLANAPRGSFWHLFYFSIETLGTLGYGDMHPETHYAHILASIEVFTGLIFAAVVTGLIFQRFSRPRARMVFAGKATVSIYHGHPTLMIRVANARLNAITNARAKLWLLRQEVSPEGQEFRRFRELKLQQSESPAFLLSWTIFHTIDEASPLHGMTRLDLEAVEATLTLAISGTDEISSQEMRGRHQYKIDDIAFGHRYVDIFEDEPDGGFVLNYHRFHEVEPE